MLPPLGARGPKHQLLRYYSNMKRADECGLADVNSGAVAGFLVKQCKNWLLIAGLILSR